MLADWYCCENAYFGDGRMKILLTILFLSCLRVCGMSVENYYSGVNAPIIGSNCVVDATQSHIIYYGGYTPCAVTFTGGWKVGGTAPVTLPQGGKVDVDEFWWLGQKVVCDDYLTGRRVIITDDGHSGDPVYIVVSSWSIMGVFIDGFWSGVGCSVVWVVVLFVKKGFGVGEGSIWIAS